MPSFPSSTMIKRIMWSVVPIPGFMPVEAVQQLFVPAFEYDDHEYYVHWRSHRERRVIKCKPMGPSVSEYIVKMGRSGRVSCDCPSGRRGLACRHKEMVRMVNDDNEKRLRMDHVVKPVVEITKSVGDLMVSADDLIERLKKAMEGKNAS